MRNLNMEKLRELVEEKREACESRRLLNPADEYTDLQMRHQALAYANVVNLIDALGQGGPDHAPECSCDLCQRFALGMPI